jgi:polyisoprenoid-binding protein YceI
MKKRVYKLIVLLVMFFSAFSLNAQVKYNLNKEKSTLQVKGTSTVHDWVMDAGDLKSNVQVTSEDGKIVQILGGSFSCPAEKILSDNSIMDKKTHNALKADDHPQIKFVMKSVESINRVGNNISGVVNGVLSIAGVSKSVKFQFTGNSENEKSIHVKGIIPLKMSDFDISPPTAMLGALKTGNEIELNYNFYFD